MKVGRQIRNYYNYNMNKKTLGIVLAVVVIVGAVGYFAFVKKPSPTSTPSPATTTTQETSAPTPSKSAKTGWQTIIWKDPDNPILGFRFDDPASWVEDSNPYGSERQITVGSCPINSCDRMSFDVQVISREYTPDANLPAGWTKSKVNIGGISADKVIKPTDTAVLTDIDFMRNNDWYHLEFYTSKANEKEAESILNHILETFTFTVSRGQQAPAEYDLLKNIDTWTLTYQDKNTSALVCSNGKKGNSSASYVFTMTSKGYGEGPDNIDTPYQKVITTLKNNGWQQCKDIGKTELQDTQGTSEVFIKNNKLIGVFRHYSMGTGNFLWVSIQY